MAKGKSRLLVHFYNMKIKYKLSVVIGLVVVIIATLTTAVFQYMVGQYDRLLYDQTANSLSFIAKDVSSELETVEWISRYVSVDSSFQSAMETLNTKEEYSWDALLAISDVQDVFNLNFTNKMLYITVLYESGGPEGGELETVRWGTDSSLEEDVVLEELLRRCDAAMGQAVWISSGREDGSILCARQIRKWQNLELRSLGYLVIRVDLDKIVRSALRNSYAGMYDMDLLVYNDRQLVYPQQAGIPAYLDSSALQDNAYTIAKLGGEQFFVTHAQLALEDDWQVVLGVEYNAIFNSVAYRNLVFFVVLLLSIVLAIWVANLIVKSITYQFNTLVEKMDRLKFGDMEIEQQPQKVNDEIGQLSEYFDQMTVELKKRIEEDYVKELLLTKAEFKALEQQIDPHFMYNTLNTVNWLAKRAGEKDISIIVEALGSLLRDALTNKEDIISIERELAVLGHYVEIQKIRFSDSLEVEIEADEGCLHIPIPKMSIQPLVENAILHSQDEVQDTYRVRLRIRRQKDAILVEVQDNGPGIDPDILRKLREEAVTPRGTGVGLLNIDARLRIIFGEEYGLFFKNEAGVTTVGFRVPVAPLKQAGEETDNV